SCHWCHVMERESFEDEEIAAFMNAHFVSVKVDREERPDLDEIYMNAVQAMTQGAGGWPMSVFLTPDLRPFFGGTYFPPHAAYGRPGFRQVLAAVAEHYRDHRDQIEQQAEQLTGLLREVAAPPVTPGEIDPELLPAAADRLLARLDPVHGGFGGAPKFPQPMNLSMLLRLDGRRPGSRDRDAVILTLDRMACGGIHDQLAGGFHRYAVDERWLVPHFEKMLYDNAQLARTYLEAFQVTGDPGYERVARRTLDYLLREMTSPEGGFFSATDADSEGEEGRYFVWQPAEIFEVLGREIGELFCRFHDVTPAGNWEGKSILRVPRPAAEVASELGLSEEELVRTLDAARERLLERRATRVPPLTDDKVITSWNALAISSLARAARVTGEARYGAAAERAAALIHDTLWVDGRLLRTRRAGRSRLPGYLEDHSFLADALIDLYEATFEARWLEWAIELVAVLDQHFWDDAGGAYFVTADDHEELVARSRVGYDSAIPAGNSVAAAALVRLGRMCADDGHQERARTIVRGMVPLVQQAPGGFGQLLQVVDLLVEPSREVVIAGPLADPRTRELRAAVDRRFLPHTVTLHADPSAAAAPPALSALVGGRLPVDGQPAAYVCTDRSCQAPVTDARALEGLLAGGC
ncbi:MAG: thioredoxin domain-containing protein, partial [Candidatus Eiseniibacteriota bacterium]